jgi:hypothetical protein
VSLRQSPFAVARVIAAELFSSLRIVAPLRGIAHSGHLRPGEQLELRHDFIILGRHIER